MVRGQRPNEQAMAFEQVVMEALRLGGASDGNPVHN